MRVRVCVRVEFLFKFITHQFFEIYSLREREK